jgi:putative Holliday junction resolvase
MKLRGKLLGLDHGLARIGVAVSDAVGISARELAIIERRSKREDFDRLNAIARQEQAVAWVIGMPENVDGDPARQNHAIKVRNWIGYFAPETWLPIIPFDEQLSSAEAAELARQKGRSSRAFVDDLAARIILQRFLDSIRDGFIPLPDVLKG